MKKEEKIYIASDHAGFELKEKIKKFLGKNNFEFEDMGPSFFKKDDDYPDFAKLVAKKISKNKNTKGILICGSGIGMSIVANKFKNVRAANIYDKFSAKSSKEHNNANIITLRARKFSSKKNIQLIKIWLETDFSKHIRHKRRIKKIK